MNRITFFIVITLLLLNCKSPNKSLIPFIQETKKERFSILIDKSDYQLTLLLDGEALKTYPVVFGTNPVDDKRMEGDRCTPEGSFKIINKYPHQSWNKFIWLNYPNQESWKKFNQAKSNGEIPDSATIGGEIGIHGVPEGKDFIIDNKNNWTWGCIAMKNKDLNEVYEAITKTTEVKIVP